MEEQDKLVEGKPMQQDEFEAKLHEMAEANRIKMAEDFEKGVLFLRGFAAVSKYKSVRRAIRRGHVSIWGDIYPRRPYNNRKLNPQRKLLREIYGQITRRI